MSIQLIKEKCLTSSSTDPIELAISIMKEKDIHIHGPEHHILDGACFLTALKNSGMDFDLEKALDEMIIRGSKMPGATCGQWGVCGSSASVGAALAIVHETGPLSDNEYYKDNLKLVSLALSRIAEIGGPRCCKRNAYLSLTTAIEFVKDNYGIILPSYPIICQFSHMNKQCLKQNCPFFSQNI